MASWDNLEVINSHLLHYVGSSTAPKNVSAALKPLYFKRNIFKLIANAPTFFSTLMKPLTCTWSFEWSFRSKDCQLVVLHTASLLDAPYEWDVNEPVARAFGYTDAHLDMLRSGDLSSTELFTDRQRLRWPVVKDLCLRNRVKKEAAITAKEMLGD
ncbi:hypothetical protein EYZ11_010663 [Aspergillus tanneri]|uniref:Carboxymuconolactone decarboxylase-like domain-containing protein n=1 Tax=Aspergillus tanneri TaxID=1220188 RepID=A0A4S3J522_9EURO|nr:uncharacterized protein ATNIH1004_009216 [Aspergillus tanneri]KAA8645005.1 hypothetical protein ATNIH1004_009216 [Aspergillus tanneri]THC89875.1 hypothetical protein EYZ11_010663 [Aspergillus tanneri]